MSNRVKTGLLIFVLSVVSLSCRLTSPSPDSWVGISTTGSDSATNAAILITQNAVSEEDIDVIPMPPPTEVNSTPTPTPEIESDGPWLVYPAPQGDGIHAYDIDTREILSIPLPAPVFTMDISRGLSPGGNSLIIRAGSPENFDELALYQIDLPSAEASQVSPLLSLGLQRDIVNEEGTRAFETLQAVTLDDGLAWSPNGRFLAFNAGLDNESSDLYVLDLLNDRIERLNGLYTQNVSPFWSPASHWLISQELGNFNDEDSWRAENVSGLEVPGFDNQNTLYLPIPESKKEVFIGWINPQSFITYSQTAEGSKTLQQVNIDNYQTNIILEGLFNQAAFDPESKSLVFTINSAFASPKGMAAGVYLLPPDSPAYSLKQAGDWDSLYWDPAGRFVASGSQGVFAFSPEGDSILLPGENNVLLSPAGNWMLAWSDVDGSEAGLRLYQPDSPHPLQTISQDRILNVIWSPDSKAFFIQSDGVLYHLQFPSLNLDEIENGFSTEEPVTWVWME
jgi:hypothetical protein